MNYTLCGLKHRRTSGDGEHTRTYGAGGTRELILVGYYSFQENVLSTLYCEKSFRGERFNTKATVKASSLLGRKKEKKLMKMSMNYTSSQGESLIS